MMLNIKVGDFLIATQTIVWSEVSKIVKGKGYKVVSVYKDNSFVVEDENGRKFDMIRCRIDTESYNRAFTTERIAKLESIL